MMRNSKKLILAGALAALGLFGAEARATFLVQVTATLNSPGGPNSGTVMVGQSATTLSVFTGAPANIDLSTATAPVHETYGTTVVTSSNTTGGDSFNFNYGWTLTFTHVVDGVATGISATLDVTGTIAGVLSANGSTLANTFGSIPTLPLLVDGRAITVTLDPYTPPGTPPSSIGNFSVSLINGDGGNFHPVPEPTTMALLGVGGLLLIAPRLRRKGRIQA